MREDKKSGVKPHLSVLDTISIIVGIVVGAGIYETAPLIFSSLPGPWTAMLVWILGGALSLMGALCYAELATTYSKIGGEYTYLTRAFGRACGFLFGWAQLSVIFTGSIGMTAYIFADYFTHLFNIQQSNIAALVAVLTVIVLTTINLVGIRMGKFTQNIFTLAKIFGLIFVIIAGIYSFFALSPTQIAIPSIKEEWDAFSIHSIGLAMVFVLYTYGGWNDTAYVASEIKDQKKIPLVLIGGIILITTIYVFVNLAYLMGLGYEGAKSSQAIAANLLSLAFGDIGNTLMSLFVMVSALGATNGLIITGSRLYTALGSDHRVFRHLSYWNKHTQTPTTSLVLQGVISCLLILLVGTSFGKITIDGFFVLLNLSTPEWQGHGGFDTLLRCTAPTFWFFFLLTGLSLFALRKKDPYILRPFQVPMYPFVPLIFCLTCGYMLIRSIMYSGSLTFIGLIFLIIGVPLYFVSTTTKASKAAYSALILKEKQN